MPDAPAFVFGIPLIARSAAYDWDVVVHHFNATLGSIFNQTDPNFRVIVACTGRPEVRIPVDDRLEFVDVPSSEVPDLRAVHHDMAMRWRRIVRHISPDGDAYVMTADADDLISRRLVAFVRESMPQHGCLVTKGYVLDARNGLLSKIPSKFGGPISFHYICGTSAILRLTSSEMRDANNPQGYFRRILRHGHPDVGRLCITEGRPLTLVPFRAVTYVRNHGANVSERMDILETAALEQKRQTIQNAAAKPLSIDTALRSEFGLDAVIEGTKKRSATPVQPFLTVAIATWRRPAGLRRVLEALRPQVEGDARREIVIVNDGSHDAAYERVISEFATIVRYEPVAENSGVGVARNRAVSMANGDFVAFIDDDCVPSPFWLDWLSARLAADLDIDVLAGTTRVLRRRDGFFERVQAHYAISPRPWATADGYMFVAANVALRRQLIQELGGFLPLRIGEDTELGFRLATAGVRIVRDESWYVEHEAERFGAKLRKYWRYGYTNVALSDHAGAPAMVIAFRDRTRRQHLRVARTTFRGMLRKAEGFSRFRFSRLAAALTVTLIRSAYFDGCAVKAKQRRRMA